LSTRLQGYRQTTDDDGNLEAFVDTITPSYYLELSKSQYSYYHYMSISYGIKFFGIMGIGALMTPDRDGEPPYLLPESAKQAFQTKTFYDTEEDKENGVEAGKTVVLKRATDHVWNAYISRSTGEEMATMTANAEMARKSIEFGKFKKLIIYEIKMFI